MTRHTIDAVMGMVVLLLAGFFLSTLLLAGNHNTNNGQSFYAYFQTVEGLRQGTDVRVGGVKIGTVSAISLDAAQYRARVDFVVENGLKMDGASKLQILSDGLMGAAYLDVTLGQSQQYLANGSEIKATEAPVALEDLLGRAIFLVAESAEN